MTILETERLSICPMTESDIADMFLIYSNEQAMRYIPYAPHKTIEETEQHFSTRLAVQWAIRLKGESRVIGALNFIDSRIPGMGYIIHPDYWGQAITAEACRALLDYAFTHLDYDRIELWIDETNKASLRVAEKLGFAIKGRLPSLDRHTGENCSITIWGVLKSDWLAGADTDVPGETKFFSVEPVLMVHDIVTSTEYYRDKLGFNVDFLYGKPPTHAGVSRGEWTTNMVSIQLMQVSADYEIKPSANLHIRVDSSLDRLFEQYRDKGVTIIEEAEDKAWGFREFVIEDLNSHRLVFASQL